MRSISSNSSFGLTASCAIGRSVIDKLFDIFECNRGGLEADNVRVIPDAGDVVTVGADTIAKLSAETSEGRPVAAWDQRIVIRANFESEHICFGSASFSNFIIGLQD